MAPRFCYTKRKLGFVTTGTWVTTSCGHFEETKNQGNSLPCGKVLVDFRNLLQLTETLAK